MGGRTKVKMNANQIIARNYKEIVGEEMGTLALNAAVRLIFDRFPRKVPDENFFLAVSSCSDVSLEQKGRAKELNPYD